MGVTTPHLSATTARQGTLARRVPDWVSRPPALRRLALASVVVNVGIVVTGGAVRLTNSGLGCPTWPRCSGADLVTTDKLGIHGAIEFGNRMLTFVVGITLVATLVVAWWQRRQVRLAALAFAGLPAQAVLGGIVTLTDLNPWVVALHFLLSMALIAATAWLWWRVREPVEFVPAPIAARRLVAVVTVAAVAVLALGTIVTGSGPHAGDADSHGTVHRTGLRVASMAQLHADSVMVLIGLSVGVLALTWAVGGLAGLRRAALGLVVIELAQGIIGYTQYFLHVPPLLVGLHMFGACLVWLATLRVLFLVEPWALGQSSRLSA